MYYGLFEDVLEDNKNRICMFQIGAFYVIINEQAIYISELLGLKKVCFAPGICKVGFPKGSLTKYMKKLQYLRISFAVLDACDVSLEADYTYKLKGYKKRYEFVDEKFVFNSEKYKCDCNKCAYNKTDIMKRLDNCMRECAALYAKIHSLAIVKDEEVSCEIQLGQETYEELTIWGEDE